MRKGGTAARTALHAHTWSEDEGPQVGASGWGRLPGGGARAQLSRCTLLSHALPLRGPHRCVPSCGFLAQKPDAGAAAPPPGAKLSFTQQVVRAIYVKWRAHAARAAAWRRLFLLTAFIGLLLGVLYAQRGAEAAYRVHSTLASVVAPPAGVLSSQDDVYDWLEGVVKVGLRPWARLAALCL